MVEAMIYARRIVAGSALCLELKDSKSLILGTIRQKRSLVCMNVFFTRLIKEVKFRRALLNF